MILCLLGDEVGFSAIEFVQIEHAKKFKKDDFKNKGRKSLYEHISKVVDFVMIFILSKYPLELSIF